MHVFGITFLVVDDIFFLRVDAVVSDIDALLFGDKSDQRNNHRCCQASESDAGGQESIAEDASGS
jgi:hypothetical protein